MLEAEQMVNCFFYNLASDIVSVLSTRQIYIFLDPNNQKLYLERTITFHSDKTIFSRKINMQHHIENQPEITLYYLIMVFASVLVVDSTIFPRNAHV